MAITISLSRVKPDYRIFVVNLQETRIIVTVTANASVVQRWIDSMYYFNLCYLDRLVVGLGVQWTPGHHAAPAETLQLCVGRRCLVYQLSHSPFVPISLRLLLECPWTTFVGFQNLWDRYRLEISEHRLYMARDPVDIRDYVRRRNGERLAGASFEEIVQERLGIAGVRMRREINLSDWNRVYLSHEQVLQVALDAYCAFKIGIYIFRSDRFKLEISEHRLYMARDPVDLRENVRRRNGESLAGASVEEIVQERLGIAGVRMRPEISRSNWNRAHLSRAQVLQVTLDAYCAFKIGIYTFLLSPRA